MNAEGLDLRAAPPVLPAKDLARFRAMFETHYDSVYRVARRSGLDESVAEDAAQQAFLVAMRRLADIEAGRERAFLCGVVLRVAMKLREERARRREDEAPASEPPAAVGQSSPPPAVDELVDHKRHRELLDAILAEMDEELRAVLVLAEIEGLGKREISDALGIPTGTAASRLRRAREDFDARLKRRRAARRTP